MDYPLYFQLSPDCKYLQTTVYFELAGEKFLYQGKQLLAAGYTGVMPWQALTSDEVVPNFRREQMCPVNDVGSIFFQLYFINQFK